MPVRAEGLKQRYLQFSSVHFKHGNPAQGSKSNRVNFQPVFTILARQKSIVVVNSGEVITNYIASYEAKSTTKPAGASISIAHLHQFFFFCGFLEMCGVCGMVVGV